MEVSRLDSDGSSDEEDGSRFDEEDEDEDLDSSEDEDDVEVDDSAPSVAPTGGERGAQRQLGGVTAPTRGGSDCIL